MNNNNNITVIFRYLSEGKSTSTSVQCTLNENMEQVIQKFRKSSGYYKNDIQFIFNAKSIGLIVFDEIKNYGITNNDNIFIVKTRIRNDCIFKISNEFFYITSYYQTDKKCSELIEEFLKDTGINSSKIKYYSYNNKNIDPSLTIKESGIKEDSDIIVTIKDKSIKYINIIFENVVGERTDVKCLKTEKFISAT